MKKVYLVQYDYSLDGESLVESEVFAEYSNAERRFKDIVKEINSVPIGAKSDHDGSLNGQVSSRYDVDYYINNHHNDNLWFNVLDTKCNINHIFLDLREITVK